MNLSELTAPGALGVGKTGVAGRTPEGIGGRKVVVGVPGRMALVVAVVEGRYLGCWGPRNAVGMGSLQGDLPAVDMSLKGPGEATLSVLGGWILTASGRPFASADVSMSVVDVGPVIATN